MTKRQENKTREARIAAYHAETLEAVKAGACPVCASRIRQNLAITGWFQCEQFGAEGFRSRSNESSCNWQGFTQ